MQSTSFGFYGELVEYLILCAASGRLGVGVSLGVTYGLLGTALVGWRGGI